MIEFPIKAASGMTDLDIWRAANIPLKRWGGEAVFIASKRADALLDQGDHHGCSTWIRIAKVLREVARIGFANPLKLLADDGTMLPIHLWRPDIAAAVQSVELHDDGAIKRVRFWSKIEALKLAMRHHGLLVDRQITEPPPAPDPVFEAKRKRLMDAVNELLARRARGVDLDKPLLVEHPLGAAQTTR